ncbi:uncharacterized protein JN550_010195 [Neoarthrinium moseri]|uniref:uncharacterized protein n=1 Tax=Neoarthrinium moseri TaxID=1658444 RepID=UPI001FDBB13F|nr:uncharacterized protein JN550_010195 [Neoarthrinium moseri]KAI1862670.1 hypothetical protein JN550_010195 [Neoarthrinium moseri]
MARPDLLVSLDIGMSCTGVATFNVNRKRLETYDVSIFREWGGRPSENKVPTVLSYDTRNLAKEPTGWGFETEEEAQNTSYHILGEWFKTRFESDEVLEIDTDPRLPRVDQLYQDYLQKLYSCIRLRFTRHDLGGKNWDEARVEFIFSIPATWKTYTVEKFKGIAQKAGFTTPQGPKHPHRFHTIQASLTEPLACAIHAATVESQTFQENDTILIVDAGGGTTDVSLVTIDSATQGQISISEHRGFPSEAAEYGATYIDEDFRLLIEEKLRARDHNSGLANKAHALSWQMMRSQDFQNSKPKLDLHQDYLEEVFRIRIKELPDDANYPDLAIINGHMEFTWGELAKIFDKQIEGMQRLIEGFLRRLESNLGSAEPRLNHIILSGGLGSSRYVQNKIESEYNQPHRSLLNGVQVHVSTDPRLCVCKGLLYERIQGLLTQKAAISRLACRQSYGILCDTKYNKWHKKQRQLGKIAKIESEKDGVKVIKDTVEWFVRKGNIVAHGEEKKFKYSLFYPSDTAKSALIGTIKIVTSSMDSPPEVKTRRQEVQDETTLICDFATLSDSHIILKNNKWYSRLLGKKPSKEVRFEIASTVGPAEVKFECRPIGGDQVLSVVAPPIKALFETVPLHVKAQIWLLFLGLKTGVDERGKGEHGRDLILHEHSLFDS